MTDTMVEALNQVFNEAPEYQQIMEILKNVSPEDLQSLADHGLDLKNLNSIEDLQNLVQYCEQIGGVENL